MRKESYLLVLCSKNYALMLSYLSTVAIIPWASSRPAAYTRYCTPLEPGSTALCYILGNHTTDSTKP